MKRYLLTLLIAIPTLVLGQQGISVKSFDVIPNDMDARVNFPKKDQNGEVCAIIKVVTTQKDFVWEPDALGIVSAEYQTGEYWLYVPRGAKRLTIKHDKLGILRNYQYPIAIQAATVYVMELVTGTVEVIVKEAEIETQWLVINSNPEGADVYLNDQLQGQTPFQKEVEVGTHTYRVEQLLYHPEVGLVTVTPRKKELMEITLRPNFGHIRVNTTPESGATVTVNGNPLSSTSPVTSDRLKSGVYTVEASKTLYHAASKQVTVSDGETTNVTLDLRPAYGGVRVTSSPESGAEILLNGSPTGKTTPATLERLPKGEHTITIRKEWFQPQTQRISLSDGEDKQLDMVMQPTFGTVSITAQDNAAIYVAGEHKGNAQWGGRLTAGLYTVEARKEKHHTDSKQLQVRIGESHTLSLHPTPMQGQLKVTTIPMDAKILLDGKEHGTTPETIRNLLVGTYSLTLQKTGYGTVTKPISIAEDKITEVNETLPTGMEVTIASTPTGAQLWIDGTPTGSTPVTTSLAFGNHSLRLVNGKKEVTDQISITQGSKALWEYDVSEFDGKNFTERVAGITIDMVAVKGGTFTMGCTGEQGGDCDDDEKPAHSVTLSDFYMGKYEVTNRQFCAFLNAKGNQSEGGVEWVKLDGQWEDEKCRIYRSGSSYSVESGYDNHPVIFISWYGARAYCQWLSTQTGKRYRLPTEAEWEYAARSGGKSYKYVWGNGTPTKSNGGNIADETAKRRYPNWTIWSGYTDGYVYAAPVGQFGVNDLGLADMNGNVWEWCADCYDSEYYKNSPQNNPQGPSSVSSRVFRGGSWYNLARYFRVSDRDKNTPDYRISDLGFRLVCEP